MKILGIIVGFLLLVGLIGFNIFVIFIGDIESFIEKLEREYDDR